MLKVIAPGTKVTLRTNKEPVEGFVIKVEINYEDFIMYLVEHSLGATVWVHESQMIEPDKAKEKEIGFHTVE